MLLKAIIAWLVIALAETLHGIARVRFLNRRVGDHRARQIGVLTGSIIILCIGWFAVPWIGIRSLAESLWIGGFWLTLMLGFDVAFGRLYLKLPWRRIAADFNVTKGGFLGIGMIVLFLTPAIIAHLRGML